MGGREVRAERKRFERSAKMTRKLMLLLAAAAVPTFGVLADTEAVGGYTWTNCISGGWSEFLI